jgi:hypothetical protein
MKEVAVLAHSCEDGQGVLVVRVDFPVVVTSPPSRHQYCSQADLRIWGRCPANGTTEAGGSKHDTWLIGWHPVGMDPS